MKLYVANGIKINLTSIFGVGKEPDSVQIDNLLMSYNGKYKPVGVICVIEEENKETKVL